MSGIDARLFFTFRGLDIVNKKKMDHLQLNLVGNPSASIPAMIARLFGVEPIATAQMKKEMTLDMFKLTKDDLVPQVEGVLTAMDFMDMTEGAQIIFI